MGTIFCASDQTKSSWVLVSIYKYHTFENPPKTSLTRDTIRSCKATIVLSDKPNLFLLFLRAFDRAVGLFVSNWIMVMKYSYGDDFAANGKAVYAKHLALVRQKMSDVGRLNENEYLEFNVKEGWEPLCKFLGKEVPKDAEGKPKPFPKVNDRVTFGQTFEQYYAGRF